MSKKKSKKKSSGSKLAKRPLKFKDFGHCVEHTKKSVYLIVRGRNMKKEGKEVVNWITLGSGFLAAPNRMLTAAHVINNPQAKNASHEDGDVYFLVRHDDNNQWHFHFFKPKINKELFVYPELDLGIIYLEDKFYANEKITFVDKEEYIRVSDKFLSIGSEIGVLGYPLCKLEFDNHDINKPKIGNILLRTDKGVVNCRYRTSETDSLYEFTLSFNPGNSGGPIFDVKTGKAISIVKGYKAIPINQKEVEIPKEIRDQLKMYEGKSYIETLHANYSMGFATPSFVEILKKHDILFSK